MVLRSFLTHPLVEQLSVQDWLLLLYQETLYLSFGMRDDEFNGIY